MKSFTTHIATVYEVDYSASRLQRIRQKHYHSYRVWSTCKTYLRTTKSQHTVMTMTVMAIMMIES
jgi:hypothetical protein